MTKIGEFELNKIYCMDCIDGMKKIPILHLTNENDIILDSFMGSGTTAVACKQLNRKFIGFEIEKKYVDVANKRLSQQTLF